MLEHLVGHHDIEVVVGIVYAAVLDFAITDVGFQRLGPSGEETRKGVGSSDVDSPRTSQRYGLPFPTAIVEHAST